jgi:hypothetical protein
MAFDHANRISSRCRINKIKKLLHSLGLVLQIYEGHDEQLNRPGLMA